MVARGTRSAARAAAAALLALALAGCSPFPPGIPGPGGAARPGGAPAAAPEDAPALSSLPAVPTAAIEGTALNTVYSDWGGQRRGPAEAIEWPEVGRGAPLLLETAHEPGNVLVRAARTVDERGLPSAEEQAVWECAPPLGSDCGFEAREGRLAFTLDPASDPDPQARYVVVQFAWTASENGAAVPLSASYVFDRGEARR